MALIKCGECGREVSDKALTCPGCGAPIAFQRSIGPSWERIGPSGESIKSSSSKNSFGCGFVLLLVFIIGIFVSIFDRGGNTSSTQSPRPATEDADKILYQVVEEWPIPNGGYGRAIVISPEHRIEEDMVQLGRQLHRDTYRDRNAFIFIFDDKVAASNRKAALGEQLGKVDLDHFDAHMIGSYTRNGTTGYHTITIFLQGANGPGKQVPIS